MADANRIELAHEPDFRLGRLTVSPRHRELIRDDGERELLEHRVMQVLVALARSARGVVSRDELTQSCWDGRIVGDDAINRVISRLRRSAEGIGAGSFSIGTVTKVGYQLLGDVSLSAPGGAPASRPVADAPPTQGRPARRSFLIGGAAAGIIALAGGGWLYHQSQQKLVPPEAATLMDQAWVAWFQGTAEGAHQAAGLFHRATELAPDYADGWGILACYYADQSHGAGPAEAQAYRERAQAAARRALALEPGNANGLAALAYARPFRGNWLAVETGFRKALAHQNIPGIAFGIGLVLQRVGRCSDAVRMFEAATVKPRPASHYFAHSRALWGAGRTDEAEHMTSEGAAIYPAHAGLWLARYHMLLFDGRPGAAAGMAEDVAGRPDGLAAGSFDALAGLARAVLSRDPAAADAIMAAGMRDARASADAAASAMLSACALGRLEDAFALAEAYYFSRGFAIPDKPVAPGEAVTATLDDRSTSQLFLPPTKAMRADPRFDRLVKEIGLERYWRDVGAQPDYRKI